MKNYKERQYVTQRKTICFDYWGTIKIDEFINRLNELKEEGWSSVTFEKEYDSNDSYELLVILTQERLETDEEYKKRIDILEANKKAEKLRKKAVKEKKDKEDFALYEKLKKKFEK